MLFALLVPTGYLHHTTSQSLAFSLQMTACGMIKNNYQTNHKQLVPLMRRNFISQPWYK